jgi:hypothetical protein
MPKVSNLKNKIFGRWLVVDRATNTKSGRSRWVCVCTCGNESIITNESLNRMKYNSSCIKCSQSRRININKTINNIPDFIWNRINYTKHKIKITSKYCFDLLINQDFKCNLSGIPLNIPLRKIHLDKGECSASLDRINSNIAYISGNVQWVYKDINIMKQSFNQDYFLKLCELISKYKKPKPIDFKNHNVSVLPRYWYSFLRNAKIRNIEVNLTINEASEKLIQQNFKCNLSGLDLYMSKNRDESDKCLTTASLDRIDSNKNYSYDNIQWIHKDINFMKNKFNENHFIYLCKKITDFKM